MMVTGIFVILDMVVHDGHYDNPDLMFHGFS